ncbi:MAG: hypothetical protein JXA78_19340 [Anaerolineales bacterium]|nr:hypothetical protein [Anaerolineales bacterium]
MHLLVLLIVFLLLGYVLADTRFSQQVDRVAGDVADASRNMATNAEDRWKSLFQRRLLADAFRTWAAGADLPQDFKRWLASLSDREASSFIQALANYARGLGYDLDILVQGGLDQEPILRQVFVEAIVVYSDAYRKARKALDEAEQAKAKDAGESASNDGKKPAAKQASRRKREAVEAPETVTVA